MFGLDFRGGFAAVRHAFGPRHVLAFARSQGRELASRVFPSIKPDTNEEFVARLHAAGLPRPASGSTAITAASWAALALVRLKSFWRPEINTRPHHQVIRHHAVKGVLATRNAANVLIELATTRGMARESQAWRTLAATHWTILTRHTHCANGHEALADLKSRVEAVAAGAKELGISIHASPPPDVRDGTHLDAAAQLSALAHQTAQWVDYANQLSLTLKTHVDFF